VATWHDIKTFLTSQELDFEEHSDQITIKFPSQDDDFDQIMGIRAGMAHVTIGTNNSDIYMLNFIVPIVPFDLRMTQWLLKEVLGHPWGISILEMPGVGETFALQAGLPMQDLDESEFYFYLECMPNISLGILREYLAIQGSLPN